MQLIAPDLFAEVAKLSWGACAIGLALGVLVWLTGWWQHRFWTVATITAVAGIVGLQSGRNANVQPLVAGLLAALAAGWMALELAKVLAFLGGGATGSVLVQTFVPNVHDPLIAFLAGGLLGVVLFRLWMLTFTSLVGSLLMAYCGLGLASVAMKYDSAALVNEKAGVLNAAVGGGVLIGVLIQGRFDSWRSSAGKRKKAKAMAALSEEERTAIKKVPAQPSGLGKFLGRKAG
ncbi:MAG: hypothetical protein U0746_15550 [Gemmataceae bacterium]